MLDNIQNEHFHCTHCIVCSNWEIQAKGLLFQILQNELFTRPLTMAIKETEHPLPNLPDPYVCTTTTTPKNTKGKWYNKLITIPVVLSPTIYNVDGLPLVFLFACFSDFKLPLYCDANVVACKIIITFPHGKWFLAIVTPCLGLDFVT